MKHKQGKVALIEVKIDINKAYDKIKRELILYILSKLDFNTQFGNFIKQCLAIVSYSFLLNGLKFRKITPSRGLRQTDPISSYLFIIAS